jgi:hypothetical protein
MVEKIENGNNASYASAQEPGINLRLSTYYPQTGGSQYGKTNGRPECHTRRCFERVILAFFVGGESYRK